MIHFPILRWGESYKSLELEQVLDNFLSDAPIVTGKGVGRF